MLTLDEVREKLKPLKINAVAEEVGLHPNAVYRLMNEQTKPSYDTVKRLSDYLEVLYK